jgi:hypothetical protein
MAQRGWPSALSRLRASMYAAVAPYSASICANSSRLRSSLIDDEVTGGRVK